MNKLLFAIVAFFALFAVSFAQEGKEESGSQCQSDAQLVSSNMGTCLSPYASITEPSSEKCPCFNESYQFYEKNPECRKDSGSKNYYEAYVKQANYNGCKDLLSGAGFVVVPSVILMVVALLF